MFETNSFPLRFDQPAWLLLLPVLLPLIWLHWRRSLAGLSRVRATCAIGLRTVLITALVLTLSRPQWNRSVDAVAVQFVVDLSDSIPPDRLRGLHDTLQETIESKPPRDLTGLIYFGAGATCEQPPSELPYTLQRQSIVDRNGTDIAEALRLAGVTFPQNVRKRIILVTDGNQNRGDALSEVEKLRGQGIQVDVLPVEYVHESEILLERALLPDQVQPGLPAELRALVHSTCDTEAIIRVRHGETQIGEERVILQEGRNGISLPVALQETEEHAGVKTFEVTVTPVHGEDDRIHDNNTAYAFTRLTGPPSVLYIDGNLGLSDDYRPVLHETLKRNLHLVETEATERSQVALDLRSVYDIPSERDLVSYDCIIIDNVAAEHLGPHRMERIRTLVNGHGTGLLMIGGENAYGVGNYRKTPIEEALPVDMDLRNKKVMPSGALILVIDRSGSMNGDKLAQAKAAAAAAVDVLSPTDTIGVVAFDGAPEWLVRPTLAQDRHAIRGAIESLGSGGGTDLVAAMQEAHKGLAPVRAAIKHMVVLSDGQSDRGVFETLMRSIETARITVSSVGLGEPGSQHFMQEIARRGGGRYYYVTDPRRLPRIFIKESMFIKRALLFEETFSPSVTDAGDDFLQSIDPALPPLHGYVATTAKPQADVPVVSANENQDPILAHWRYGLGRAVAFTSDAKNRWSADWLSWRDFADFWSGLVYRILRQQPANLRMITTVEDGRGKIVAHAFDDEGVPLPLLRMKATVTDPLSKVQHIQLRQTGICTYEGEFYTGQPGRYEVAVMGESSNGTATCAAYGGTALPFSEESRDMRANLQMLHRLAQVGGGRLLAQDNVLEQAFRRADLQPAILYRDCWVLLLALTAVLFPLDVFVRRVMVDASEIRRWIASGASCLRRSAPPREERVAMLMEAKRRATPPRPERVAGAPTTAHASSARRPEPPVHHARDVNVDAGSDAGSEEAGNARTQDADQQQDSAAGYTQRLLQAKRRLRERPNNSSDNASR